MPGSMFTQKQGTIDQKMSWLSTVAWGLTGQRVRCHQTGNRKCKTTKPTAGHFVCWLYCLCTCVGWLYDCMSHTVMLLLYVNKYLRQQRRHQYSPSLLACGENLHHSPTTFWNSSADLNIYKKTKAHHHRTLQQSLNSYTVHFYNVGSYESW